MGNIHQIEQAEIENVPRSSDTTQYKIPSIVEKKPRKTKSAVLIEALYLQEDALDKDIVSTSLETIHEDRNRTGYKCRRMTFFARPYSVSNEKIKSRRKRARILRKQGIKVPTGNMFTDQDVFHALTHRG